MSRALELINLLNDIKSESGDIACQGRQVMYQELRSILMGNLIETWDKHPNLQGVPYRSMATTAVDVFLETVLK